MKKESFRRGMAALLVCVLCLVCCGCELFAIVEETQDTQPTQVSTIHLEGLINCYEQPSMDSNIAAVFPNGQEFTVQQTTYQENIEWALTEFGWVILRIDAMETEEPTQPMTLIEGVINLEWLNVRTGPGLDYDAVDRLLYGTSVVITETAQAADGAWGKIDGGWISMPYVYILGEMGIQAGYGVVREHGATVYDQIMQPREKQDWLDVGERVYVYHRMTVNQEPWGYTDGGWVQLSQMYMEGDEGLRPSAGIVDDVTPLNVREGPSMDYKVLCTIPVGDFVEIYDQITRNGSDWGYIGYGWVFMGNVMQQEEFDIFTSDLMGYWFSLTEPMDDGNGGQVITGCVMYMSWGGSFTQEFYEYVKPAGGQWMIQLNENTSTGYTLKTGGQFSVRDNVLQLTYTYRYEAAGDGNGEVEVSYNDWRSTGIRFANDYQQINMTDSQNLYFYTPDRRPVTIHSAMYAITGSAEYLALQAVHLITQLFH